MCLIIFSICVVQCIRHFSRCFCCAVLGRATHIVYITMSYDGCPNFCSTQNAARSHSDTKQFWTIKCHFQLSTATLYIYRTIYVRVFYPCRSHSSLIREYCIRDDARYLAGAYEDKIFFKNTIDIISSQIYLYCIPTLQWRKLPFGVSRAHRCVIWYEPSQSSQW